MYASLLSRESVWIWARFLQADWKVIKWQQTRACCFRHPYEMIMTGLTRKHVHTHTHSHTKLLWVVGTGNRWGFTFQGNVSSNQSQIMFLRELTLKKRNDSVLLPSWGHGNRFESNIGLVGFILLKWIVTHKKINSTTRASRFSSLSAALHFFH